MRILFIVATLFVLAGCESMEFVAVDYHSGYNYGPYVRPVGHISYTLGYYSGNYYNGWAVYGSHGHRYYHAPRYYSHHRHFARPVVVQHVHVHATYCEHNYRPRTGQRSNHRERDSNRNTYVQPQVRNDTRRTPSRVAPTRQRNDVAPTRQRNDVAPRTQTRNDTQRREATPPRTRRQPTRAVPQQPRTQQATPSQNKKRVERPARAERRKQPKQKRK